MMKSNYFVFLVIVLLAVSSCIHGKRPLDANNNANKNKLVSPPKSTEIVYTLSGPIQGFIDPVTGIQNYLGIPYSIPPVGEYRFNLTHFPEIWTTPLQATSFSPNCLQNNPLLPGTQDEDCLYLNILAPPGTTQESNWPVLVWIHGGGWYTGSGSEYNGSGLVLGGNVIFVSFNYRLNALGYMSFPGREYNHAWGLADQRLALNWISLNIAYFGGDMNMITVFGESAGSASAALPTAYSQSEWSLKGLILQSLAMYPFVPVEKNTENSLKWAASLGCSDSDRVVDCLRALPASQISSQLYTIGTYEGLYETFMLPSVGTVEIPPGSELGGPYSYYNNAGDFPVMYGSNEVEGNLFAAYNDIIAFKYPNFTLTNQQYSELIEGFFGPLNATEFITTTYQDVATKQGNWAAWSAMLGDYYISCPTRLVGRNALWESASTYRYLLKRDATLSPLAWLNATHGDDLFFLFPGFLNCTFTPDEQVLSQQMITYWTNFARCQNPNLSVCPDITNAQPPQNQPQIPNWPVFRPSSPSYPNSQSVLVLNAPTITYTNDWNYQSCLPFLQFFDDCC